MTPPRVVVVSCYFDPDYVRGTVIWRALAETSGFEVARIRSTSRGLWRYPQIAALLIADRVRRRPDAYILTFRGQEILGFVLALAGRVPVVFDEFIVPKAYATQERHARSWSIRVKYALARMAFPAYNRMLARTALVLSDTEPHARLSSETSGLPIARYRVLPVGADETIFRPAERRAGSPFTVLYYGNMLPLHGLETVLAAAIEVAGRSDIRFLVVGGGTAARGAVTAAAERGAAATHVDWIPYEDLPATIADSDLCLGGPFGGTPQAERVVTGKTYQFLASGAPTVVGAGQASDDFDDRVNALVVPQRDARALADAISWAADHPKELAEVGRRGRALYESRYSTEVLGRRLTTWLSTLLDDEATKG